MHELENQIRDLKMTISQKDRDIQDLNIHSKELEDEIKGQESDFRK